MDVMPPSSSSSSSSILHHSSFISPSSPVMFPRVSLKRHYDCLIPLCFQLYLCCSVLAWLFWGRYSLLFFQVRSRSLTPTSPVSTRSFNYMYVWCAVHVHVHLDFKMCITIIYIFFLAGVEVVALVLSWDPAHYALRPILEKEKEETVWLYIVSTHCTSKL